MFQTLTSIERQEYMKRSFLDTLSGLDTNEAVAKVKAEGFEEYVVPQGIEAITSVARPKTVVLWERNGKVSAAQAGDPVELED